MARDPKVALLILVAFQLHLPVDMGALLTVEFLETMDRIFKSVLVPKDPIKSLGFLCVRTRF